MFPTDPDLSTAEALRQAAALPGAQLFVFPAGGNVEAIVVVAPDRVVWELRTENAVAWLAQLGLAPGRTFADVEAAVAYWTEWVPVLFRGVILGTESAEDFAAPRH